MRIVHQGNEWFNENVKYFHIYLYGFFLFFFLSFNFRCFLGTFIWNIIESITWVLAHSETLRHKFVTLSNTLFVRKYGGLERNLNDNLLNSLHYDSSLGIVHLDSK